jgi:hypothetical protein
MSSSARNAEDHVHTSRPPAVLARVVTFNRRHTLMAAFQTLLGLGGQHSATTYRELCEVE